MHLLTISTEMYKRHAPTMSGSRSTKRVKKTPAKINKSTYTVSPVARTELKARPQYTSGTMSSGAPFSTVLGTVDLGDEYFQRNGRAIRHISSDIYLELTRVTNDTPAVTRVRVIYGVWKQSALAPSPGYANVLDIAGFSGGEEVAPFNSQYSSNMVILWDELVTLDGQYNGGATTPGTAGWSKKRTFSYKGVQEYNGPNDGDVNNWNHFIMLVPAGTGSPQYKIGVQHYFTDA